MAELVISCVSQKGGVGKSTLSRLIAREYANADWIVKIADMDTKQGTCLEWNRSRQDNKVQPDISVESFNSVDRAIKTAEQFDLLIFDGQARSDAQTKEIAKVSNLILLPTGSSLDDLRPTVRLAHDLKKHGIDKKKIAFVRSRTSSNENENLEVEEYLQTAGYAVLEEGIPELVSIRKALDQGFAPSEVTYKTVKEKVLALSQSVVAYIEDLSK